MICYLVRHGKDDDSVRGGWSDYSLTKVDRCCMEGFQKRSTERSKCNACNAWWGNQCYPLHRKRNSIFQ